VYLLWTFRHFRSLPQKVLNPRQQQLIGRLYRDAANHSAREIETVVVGTVEGFSPSSLSLPAAPRPRKLAPVIPAIDLPNDCAVPQGRAFHARFAFRPMLLRVGAAALAGMIAILAWRQLGAQPVSRSGPISETPAVPLVAEVKTDEAKPVAKDISPVTVSPPSNPVAGLPSPVPIASQDVIAPPPTQVLAAAETIAKPSVISGARASSTRGPGNLRVPLHHQVVAPPMVYEALADQPRMQISGRPQKLVYPVCPETHARGRVSLQAVVGYDGAVSRVRVLTGDRTLAAAAVEAVRQWRYQPFSGATQPLERETHITISFISNEVVAVSFPSSAQLSR
jgi:periplasmic protein TonB